MTLSQWPAAIAAVSGLCGATIGGAITFATQRADRRERSRGELGAALVAYGYALDMLQMEISKIPPRTLVARLADAAINEHRFPNLNFLLNWAHAKSLGRDAARAVDRLVGATNRLLLVAPAELLPLVQEINELLAHVSDRDAAWERQWHEERGRFIAAARDLVGAREKNVTYGRRS